MAPCPNGRCVIESLAKMLDLSPDDIRLMFEESPVGLKRDRDPSNPKDMIDTLLEYDYMVCEVGPEGIGTGVGSKGFRLKGRRRMVGMRQKNDPTKGHVIVVFEDETIFDSDKLLTKDNPASQFLAHDLEVMWTALITKADE